MGDGMNKNSGWLDIATDTVESVRRYARMMQGDAVNDIADALTRYIRQGIPVSIVEAIRAIDYQTRLKECIKQRVWWRRVLRWAHLLQQNKEAQP